MNKFNVYDNYGFQNYEGLITFGDLFTSYEVWKTELNNILLDITIEDNEYAEKIYNRLFNLYRNDFFRYNDVGVIFERVSIRIQELYQSIKVKIDFATKPDLTSTTTDIKRGKTNNTRDDNRDGFQTEYESETTDNSELYIDNANKSIQRAKLVGEWIAEFRTMFRNKSRQIGDLNLLNKE